MKYNYLRGVEEGRRYGGLLFGAVGAVVLVGGYTLLNYVAPSVHLPFDAPADAVANKLTSKQPDIGEDRLYIPKINVDLRIVTGNASAALEAGAWYRNPDTGNPKSGGNFALSAVRFAMKSNPLATKSGSPFYNLSKLENGDQVYVDYDGVRYAYTVDTKTSMQTVELAESASAKDQLTLYATDETGEAIESNVIRANPLGTVAWDSGTPKIKTIN